MHNNTWKKEKRMLSEAYDSINKDDTDEKVNESEIDVDTLDKADAIADTPIDVPHEPDELDAEIESLENLLANPDPARIKQYAQEGRLGDYIDMLQKKLQAAEAVKSVVRGESE